jgi:dATP pyrophosphohydrolase
MPESVKAFKRPESVLVVVHTRTGKVLLLKRADHSDFWQSVTGAMEWDERDPRATALRELREETGLQAAPDALRDLALVQRYRILPQWRHRYAPEVTENTEHAYALELPAETVLALHPEHTQYGWFEFPAAIARVTSWTNRAAIEHVARRYRES